ncbi:hybrid sensor histidine kinase/response regulator [Ramlibacter monticola]|uniref:hybrid sensor histidine kinase/response regulator n=1 Tax=Ramlibacter monticola TaxID=1926872 RepID=UPI001919FAC1
MPAFVPPPPRHLLTVTAAFLATAVASTWVFGTLTPIWYSNAIAFAALLVHPLRSWPWFLVPIAALDAAVIHFIGHGPPLPLALADVLEIALAALFVRATGGVRFPVFEGAQMTRVIVACLLVPVASAALAAASLRWYEGAAFATVWRTWYAASALGMLVAGPFLLSWMDRQLRAEAFARRQVRPALVLALGALLAAAAVHSEFHEGTFLLAFPILIALTWWYGLAGATLGVAAVTVALFWATLQGRGGIAHMLAGETLAVQMETAQLFLAALLLSSLPLALLRSQQGELAQRLRRASDARTEFLAAMSHEIRTPMTGVLGMVDLLAAEPLTPQQKRYVEAMHGSGRHLLSVINDILDFTRIETGRLEFEEVDFSLGEVLEQVRSLAHPLAVERGLAVQVDEQLHLEGILRGDPLRLRQVLLNLVGNAIKFTEKGSVSLRALEMPADHGQRKIAFEVRDTGVGIAPDKLQTLFAPFTQADRSTSRRYGGSGLGLAISQRLVQAMGGQIGVTSQPGEGSVFRFELAFRPGDPRRVAAETRREAQATPPQRILIAEDVDINREILRTALARDGHVLRFAATGVEALAAVQEQAFDLVLMDVQMPVMDGVEATRQIRRLPAPTGQVPIIGLTANVMAHERELYLEAGMDDCLPKPIDWDRLRAALARITRTVAPPDAPQEIAAPPVLVDEATLAVLQRMADGNELAELLRTALRGYEEGCAGMEQEGAGAEAIAQQAHRIRGSAGTFGLEALFELATRLEQAALRGLPTADLVVQLRATVVATRAELERRGLLREPSTT